MDCEKREIDLTNLSIAFIIKECYSDIEKFF